jgi:hypothetical protein
MSAWDLAEVAPSDRCDRCNHSAREHQGFGSWRACRAKSEKGFPCPCDGFWPLGASK